IAGRRAETQAARAAGSDRATTDQDRQASGTTEQEAPESGRNRSQVRQYPGPLQNGQALSIRDRGRDIYLDTSGRIHSTGNAVGWHLRDPHQRTGRALIRRRHGTQLQEAIPGRARFSQLEGRRSVSAADSSSQCGSSGGAYFLVSVGLLRGMAYAPCLGALAI